jgi:hypothetical protein
LVDYCAERLLSLKLGFFGFVEELSSRNDCAPADCDERLATLVKQKHGFGGH